MAFEKLRKESLKKLRKDLKESVSDDQLIINAVNSIEELEKTGNMLVTRLREWYALYNPEFEKWMDNQEKFAELVISKDKKTLLNEIKAKESIGANLPKKDIDAMMILAKQAKENYNAINNIKRYIEFKMKKYCPNLLEIVGTMLGAKLIAKAGSLKRLSQFPASTIQILGAEKALFRHMKTGARPPRHGILIQHPIVAQAKQKDHGRRARTLADKISIATKVDYFKGDFIGKKLKKELIDKFGVDY
jgi:nucleolar protein 56